jgi:hypothetical protein
MTSPEELRTKVVAAMEKAYWAKWCDGDTCGSSATVHDMLMAAFDALGAAGFKVVPIKEAAND